MTAVLLNPTWPTAFRRGVRDKDGKLLRTLVFRPGEPQLLEAEDAAAIADDIGKALVEPAEDSAGNPLTKPKAAQSEAKPRGRRRNG